MKEQKIYKGGYRVRQNPQTGQWEKVEFDKDGNAVYSTITEAEGLRQMRLTDEAGARLEEVRQNEEFDNKQTLTQKQAQTAQNI